MSGQLSTLPAIGPGFVGPHDPKDVSRYAGQKLGMPSLLRAAQAELGELNDAEGASLFEGFSAWLRRTGRVRDGMSLETPAESGSEYLEGLLDELGEADWSALEAKLKNFPHLHKEANPLRSLLAGGLEPGEAALLMAALASGNETKRLQHLRKLLEGRRGALKKTLDKYLKEKGGAVGLSLFSFLEFDGDDEQQDRLKSLYRYACDACPTTIEVFKHLMRLEDREAKLRAVLRAIALELSSAGTLVSKEQARLLASMKDMRRVLILFGLQDTCQKTAKQLGALSERALTGDEILEELIATAELAWIEAGWLEGRLALLFGIGDVTKKLVCARTFKEIWKALPEAFFEDQEKRKQTLTAFEELLQTLEEQESGS